MQTSPPPVHTTSDFHCTCHSLIAIPQDCRMAQYDELRPHTAASDDTVKDAATTKPVVVPAELCSRVVSNPAFHELIKAHLVTCLIVNQPLRYIFSHLLEVFVHRFLLYVVHRICDIIAFVSDY